MITIPEMLDNRVAFSLFPDEFMILLRLLNAIYTHTITAKLERFFPPRIGVRVDIYRGHIHRYQVAGIAVVFPFSNPEIFNNA